MANKVNIGIFETMPVPKAVRKLMLPTIMSSMVMVIYSLADTFFVGLINDPIQNAAVALAAPILLAFNAVNNLFGVGSSSMMSRALGRKEYDTVKKGAAFGFYMALICGIIFSLLSGIFFFPLLKILGADATTLDATANYMKYTVVIGAAPSIINVVFSYLVRAEGESLHASLGPMSGCILNMILDPIFIMPWGLNMGAAGAGLATLISNIVSCCYFFILLYKRRGKTFVSINPKDFALHKPIIKEVCMVGIPASIQNLLNVVGMTILNNFTAQYNANAVAAMGIAQKLYVVPVQIAMGGSQGVMPLIGYSFSSKNYDRFKKTIKFVACLMLPVMVLISLISYLFAHDLVRMFIANEAVIQYGVVFLRGYCVAIPFLITDFLVVGVMQSIGKGFITLIMAMCRKIIFEIPAIFLLNYWFHENGIAFSSAIAEVFMTIISMVLLGRLMVSISSDKTDKGSKIVSE